MRLQRLSNEFQWSTYLIYLFTYHVHTRCAFTIVTKRSNANIPCLDVQYRSTDINSDATSSRAEKGISWWGRGGLPQRIPPLEDNEHTHGYIDVKDGEGGDHFRPTRRRTARNGDLFRYEPRSEIADPLGFLQSWGFHQWEIHIMQKEFPPLTSSLDVKRHLEPKIRFLYHTLDGASTDQSCGKLSDLAKSIPPQYFGCRLEKSFAPRHAYLKLFGLPHGRTLLEDNATLLKEFLWAGNKSASADFVLLCRRWEQKFGANLTHHNEKSIEVFENAFRKGLLDACRSQKDSSLVKLLIEHGANLLELDGSTGASLLHWTAGIGNAENFMTILNSIVDRTPTKVGREATSALVLMETRSRKDSATCLHWACCGVSPDRFGSGGHVNLCRRLLDIAGDRKYALVNSITITGNSPLMWACWAGSVNVAKVLSSKGSDVHMCNANGCTAAHWAATSGSVEVCKFLFNDLGADFKTVNQSGSTPLHHAITYGHKDVVEWLTRTFYSTLLNGNELANEKEYARKMVSWRPVDYDRQRILDIVSHDVS